MRTKVLFLFLLLTVNFRGFSQENNITLFPGKDISSTVNLYPVQGNGDAINLPVVLNWNKEENSIKILFEGTGASNRFIYFFPKRNFFSKIKKLDKQIWFSREIQKYAIVERCLDSLDNVMWKNEFSDIKESSLSGPAAPLIKCMFLFELQNPDVNSCRILMRIYVAAQESGKSRFLFFPVTSKRDRKIEFLSEITLNINLQDICESPGLKDIIEQLTKETDDIQTLTTRIASESNGLSSLPPKKIKELNNKRPFGKDKKYSIKDEQYNDCENLKKVIDEYNNAIDSYDNIAITYNNALRKIKFPAVDCRLVQTVNKQLKDLYYKMEQSGQTGLSSYQLEYEEIKSKINVRYKACNEYAAYEEWCNGIDGLLKK